ncbi:MAG TPA: stress response translation initiation inhibitor YciH [Solirubrobacteraceae bacterium]|nr:stress response translation initiation inhibitor YciH [Solirubrobacteraceae bacterium]
MPRHPRPDARQDAQVVWSSDAGDRRRQKPEPPQAAPPVVGGRVKVRREVAGRRGKPVTTISGLPLDDAALRELAGQLKRRCGVGGSVRDGAIELQGDHRPLVMQELAAAGHDAVLAGG